MTTQGRARSGYSAWRLIAEELRRDIVIGAKPPGSEAARRGGAGRALRCAPQHRAAGGRRARRRAPRRLPPRQRDVRRRAHGAGPPHRGAHPPQRQPGPSRPRLGPAARVGRRAGAAGRCRRAAGSRRARGPAARDRACGRRTPAVTRHALVRGRPRARARAALQRVRVDHRGPAGERDRRLRARLDDGRRAARHGGRGSRAWPAARLGRAGHAFARHPHRRHAAAGRHHPVRGRLRRTRCRPPGCRMGRAA